MKPWKVHLVSVAVVGITAVILLVTVFPYLGHLVFPPTARRFTGLRLEPFYYLTLALVPVVVWLIPPLVRALARGTYSSHRALVGRSGFYIRFPVRRELRFRDTVVMSLGPFAVDLLVIAEIEFFFATPDLLALGRGFIAVPALLLLAGLVTALVPGPWLVDALDIRLVNPARGEVVRAAALFESVLGPIGAVALLASFITTLHQVNYSYEQGLVTLGEWGVRLFPPVLAAVSVYRVVVQPDVLPSLERWCEAEGIPVKQSLAEGLSGLKPRPPESPEVIPDSPPVSDPPR